MTSWPRQSSEAVSDKADEISSRTRQGMIFCDPGVVQTREVQFVSHIVEIQLDLQMLIDLIGSHGIEHHVGGHAGGVLGIGKSIAYAGHSCAHSPCGRRLNT